jgi:hypothetical protein
MLAGMNSPLDPPNAPFAGRQDSSRSFSPKDSPLMSSGALPESPSLSVNYLPSKFSNAVITKRRKGGKNGGYLVPKQGGGREAFKSNESRMPGENDDDYDGLDMFGAKEGGRTRPKGRWNRFKWCLFVANFIVSAASPCLWPATPPLRRRHGTAPIVLVSGDLAPMSIYALISD